MNHLLFPEYDEFPKNFPSMCFSLLLWYPLSGCRCTDQHWFLPHQTPSGTGFSWEIAHRKTWVQHEPSPSCLFHPMSELRPTNSGPRQEALIVGGFTIAELPDVQGGILRDNIQLLYTQNAIHNRWSCAKREQTELRELERSTQYFLNVIIIYHIPSYHTSFFSMSFWFWYID